MTHSQIFKHDLSLNVLYDFLDNICEIKDNEYIFKNSSYKKGVMMHFIEPFCAKVEPSYYISKKHYVNKKINYKSLATIIRQICKFKKINIRSNITYNKSTYEIIYYIKKINYEEID